MATVAVFALSAIVAPADATEKTLRVGLYAFPPGMGNPFSQTNLPAILVWPAVMEPLTVTQPDGSIGPLLAVSWESVDKRTWRFELRRDVWFSNGEPFDAEAVVATFDWLKTDAARTMMMSSEMANIAGARALGSHLVEITTHEPDAMLPRALSVLRIVPPRYWSETGPAGFARMPVGTGSFIVKEWGRTRIVMQANPDSWRPPRLDRIEFFELPETPARLQGMQSGALDIALRFSPDDAPALESVGARLIASPTGSVYGISFITNRASPLDDRRVRLALNMAVDREQIVRELFHGTTEIATQHVSRFAFGYAPELEPYPYDPEAARKLLREAGYPDGFRFVAQVVVGALANDSLVFQQIAASLREIGVTLELHVMPTQILLRNIFTAEWRGHAFGMDYGASPFLDGWRPFRMHSCLWPQPWFCDESLTPLILEVRHEFDLERRADLMKQLLAAYQEAAPALMVYEGRSYDAVAGHVRHYQNAFGVINFHRIEVATGR